MRKLLTEQAAFLDAGPGRVIELMLRVQPGPVGADNAGLFADAAAGATVRGGPKRFNVEGDGFSAIIEIDRAGASIAYEGGWWYRGEYHAESDAAGTVVVLRVFNVARRRRWAVPLANRFFIGFRRRTRATFMEDMGRLARTLGCTVAERPTS